MFKAKNNNDEKDKRGASASSVNQDKAACEKCAEYLAGWKRALADYQNLKQQSAEQITDFRKFAQADLLEQLIPITDYFQQAFKNVPEAEQSSSWLQGIKYIQQNFDKVLSDNGVMQIKSVGEMFDPNLHEAVGEVESTEAEGTIMEEKQAGFTLHGKLLRPAKVITAKNIIIKQASQEAETSQDAEGEK